MAEKSRVSIDVKPRYGDEFRASGVVHDLTYFPWAREAQGAYFRHLGLETPPDRTGIVVRTEGVYTTPMQMTEEAKVYARTTRIGRSSITLQFQINEAASGRQVATITVVGVWVDAQTGRSVPVSDEIKQKVIAFEGKENVEVAGG